VVVAPHPDDESLGVGGLIHMCLNAGWRVEIISVTDGDAAYGEANQLLGKRRLREQARASEALGGEAPSRPVIHRVGLPDGDVAAHEAELEDELTDLLLGADWCFTTSRQDGHPDHEAAGRAAAAAAKGVGIPSAEYPIWAWEWRTPDSFPLDRAVRVALPASSRAAKASAIAEHASQLLPYGDGTDAVLPPEVLSHFDRPFEVLLLP
jgi:LmbE family N-acetylglucosaminyl deacetylase